MTNLMNSGKPKQWQEAGIIGVPVLRIYQVTECDWWAGYDIVSVQAAYRECVGEEADDYMGDFGMPEAIADEDLDDFIVTDVDEPEQPKHTGREILAEIIASKRKVPCFVASTEY